MSLTSAQLNHFANDFAVHKAAHQYASRLTKKDGDEISYWLYVNDFKQNKWASYKNKQKLINKFKTFFKMLNKSRVQFVVKLVYDKSVSEAVMFADMRKSCESFLQNTDMELIRIGDNGKEGTICVVGKPLMYKQ